MQAPLPNARHFNVVLDFSQHLLFLIATNTSTTRRAQCPSCAITYQLSNISRTQRPSGTSVSLQEASWNISTVRCLRKKALPDTNMQPNKFNEASTARTPDRSSGLGLRRCPPCFQPPCLNLQHGRPHKTTKKVTKCPEHGTQELPAQPSQRVDGGPYEISAKAPRT